MRKLYLQGMYLLCRSCAGLKYVSQRLRPQERRSARIALIRAKLGPNIGGIPTCPRGMGRAEYFRLRAQLDKVLWQVLLEDVPDDLTRSEAHVKRLSAR